MELSVKSGMIYTIPKNEYLLKGSTISQPSNEQSYQNTEGGHQNEHVRTEQTSENQIESQGCC